MRWGILGPGRISRSFLTGLEGDPGRLEQVEGELEAGTGEDGGEPGAKVGG